MTTAFQSDAFQVEAFQIDSGAIVTVTRVKRNRLSPIWHFGFVDEQMRLRKEQVAYVQQEIVDAIDGTMGSASETRVDIVYLTLITGSGSPEGAVVGSPPDVYLNRNGGAGTTMYVKESGISTNTGWVAK